MTKRTTFLTRFLAMALALVLCASNVMPGLALNASAATDAGVQLGALLADKFEMSDAEAALLKSGYLYGDKVIAYSIPDSSDELVAVDTASKTITAKPFQQSWVPSVARVVGETVEEVALTYNAEKGCFEGNYSYAGNTFSVEVDYQLPLGLSQMASVMFNAANNMVASLNNMSAAYEGTKGKLGNIAGAIGVLKQLAEGLTIEIFGTEETYKLGDEAAAAVYALDAEINANGGKMDLDVMSSDYNNAEYKTQYLYTNGAAFCDEVAETYKNLKAISTDKYLNHATVDSYLKANDEAGYTQWMAMKDIIGGVVSALEPISGNNWATTNLVNEGTDFAKLEGLVTKVDVNVTDPVTVATTTIQANLNMANVNVEVRGFVIANEVDSYELTLVCDGSNSYAKAIGTNMAEIQAGADATAAEIFATWAELMPAEYYELKSVECDHEEDALAKDATFKYVYGPKDFVVVTNYSDPAGYPYGYVMTLPVHENPANSYDYTVNGEAYAQGENITITGETEISRKAGKAYNVTDLYTVVSDNYGSKSTSAILKSGALKGNETISYRKPDPTDSDAMLALENNVLTAEGSYPADYKGLSWAPYTYGGNGTENKFSGNTADWNQKAVKVQYILNLTNFSAECVEELLNAANQIKADAVGHVEVLNSLANNYETMGQLNLVKLAGLDAVIGVTDFTPGDDTKTDERNVYLQGYFQDTVGAIIDGHLAKNEYLKIYNYMTAYLDAYTGGLKFYYTGTNAADLIAEVEALAGYLDAMVEEEEALKILCNVAGFPQVAEQINDLQGTLDYVRTNLTAPNALINTNSNEIPALIEALEAEYEEGDSNKLAASPYVVSDSLMATDASLVYVQVIATVGDKSATFTTNVQEKGILPAVEVETLKAELDAFIAEAVGAENVGFYKLSTSADLDALVGEHLSTRPTITYDWTVKTYTIKIAGAKDQYITYKNRTIELPKHDDPDYAYEYTIDGVDEITADKYTFTVEQLNKLFTNGTYVISRIAVNESDKFLEELFKPTTPTTKPTEPKPTQPGETTEPTEPEAPTQPAPVDPCVIEPVRNEKGELELVANMSGDQAGVMGLVTDLMMEYGASYIAFNGHTFMTSGNMEARAISEGETDGLEVSIQALIDAMLEDKTFSHQTLIDLGNNGNGKLLKTTLSMKVSGFEKVLEYPFTLNLTSTPAQMATLANGLNSAKSYIRFNSNNGVMEIDLDLPEAVYEAYLTAMLGTKELSKIDINAMSNKVAYQFVYDYLHLILDNEAVTAQSFENTLKMLGADIELADKPYYDLLKATLASEYLLINGNEENTTIEITALDKHINKVVSMVGIDLSNTELMGGLTADALIKELKEGGNLNVNMKVTLLDANEDYEAAVINVANHGSAMNWANNIVDFVEDLNSADLSGAAYIILLDEVDSINLGCKTAIIDLNGQTVKGDINYTGSKLVIMDSSRNTVSGAKVMGNVKGDVSILAGYYAKDVSNKLPDGYYQKNGNVLNALYTVEDGAMYTIETDKLFDENYVEGYLPAVHYLAAEIGLDMILNHYTTAALSVAADGQNYDIFAVAFDDLVGMVGSPSNKDKVANLVNDVLALYRFGNFDNDKVGGIDGFLSKVVMDLTDFRAVRDAVKNGTELVSYKFTTAPWHLGLKHVADGDYLTAGIVSDASKAESYTVGIKFSGNNKNKVLPVLNYLAATVWVNDFKFDLHQPKVVNDLLNIGGGAVTDVTLDFSRDCNYNRMLAALLAFSSEELTMKMVKDGCIMDLNDAMAVVTVGDFFGAIKKAVEAKEWDFAALAAKANVKLSKSEVETLNEYYDLFQKGAGKVLGKIEVKTDRFAPLSELANPHAEIGAATFTIDGEIGYHDASVDYRGYGVKVTLDGIKVSLTVKLAPKCNGLWGDVNWDGRVNAMDATRILRYATKLVDADQVHRCVADVNGDGKINAMDATQILRKCVKLIDKFPVEK